MTSYYISGDGVFGVEEFSFILQVNGNDKLLSSTYKRDMALLLSSSPDVEFRDYDDYVKIFDLDDFQDLVDKAFPDNNATIINSFVEDLYRDLESEDIRTNGEMIVMSFVDINGERRDNVFVLADSLRKIGRNIIFGFMLDNTEFKYFVMRPDSITSASG